MDKKYHQQVKLLLEVLPFVMKEDCFALKGGTALNLFMWDFPRLSVDIDLTYVPLDARDIALKNIDNGLANIKKNIEKARSDLKVQLKSKKLIINAKGVAPIKIEPNTILRGTLYPIVYKDLASKAEDEFNLSVLDVRMLSLADLYGGKIVAALDRQHPRDLFDVKMLFEHDGLTDDIRKAFLVYLISHERPMHEVLKPNLQNIDIIFEREFLGMTSEPIELEVLIKTRESLIEQIHATLTQDEKEFLMSFKRGEPTWSLLGVTGVEALPAVQWKLKNIKTMTIERQDLMLEKLENALSL
ncbi:MAG: nucleotidyl transferase AbiEii/AbiGii toxin family protein [Proteobacteria bacterium]|nr:nucleotidyl transferase AbiEii/AbiGii toxin family protein [Pseudomonadota bacterium]